MHWSSTVRKIFFEVKKKRPALSALYRGAATQTVYVIAYTCTRVERSKPYMFGYVCGGRPVETNVQQIEPTKFVFRLDDAARINYISIFLLPGAQLPPDFAAAVYAQLPNKTDFQFLGALMATKQSVIFKLNMSGASSMTHDVDEMVDEDEAPGSSETVITFGISIEPQEQVEQNIAAKRMEAAKKRRVLTLPNSSNTSAPDPPTETIQKMTGKIISLAYDYLGSFVDPQGKVPLKLFEDWWNKFKGRMQADPVFVKSLGE